VASKALGCPVERRVGHRLVVAARAWVPEGSLVGFLGFDLKLALQTNSKSQFSVVDFQNLLVRLASSKAEKLALQTNSEPVLKLKILPDCLQVPNTPCVKSAAFFGAIVASRKTRERTGC